MSFGIQVKNIYDEVQIDGIRKNLQVLGTGVSNLTNIDWAYNPVCPVYANFNNNQLVFARSVLPSNQWISCSSVMYPDNTLNIGADTSIYYVILEPLSSNPIASAGNFGLNIYGESGLTVFSSAQKNFIIDAAITITSNGYGSDYDIYLPAIEYGKRYFQMLLRWGNQEYQEGYAVRFHEYSDTHIGVELDEAAGTQVTFLTGFY